ncbi:hypothetical protein FJT64_005722 [Amphibalanus amphitrite]|uniref:Uncharacterized protein n=1 Tax=Amphibalanus amphitrite TaxID=1232801 RepID=A0A6A4VZ45_AMPAM|nr:hypothetical protein FJT64_005722 [Amphibalanus amphitrite]
MDRAPTGPNFNPTGSDLDNSPRTVEDCTGRGVTDPGVVWARRLSDPGVWERRDHGVEDPEEDRWAVRPREPLPAD